MPVAEDEPLEIDEELATSIGQLAVQLRRSWIEATPGARTPLGPGGLLRSRPLTIVTGVDLRRVVEDEISALEQLRFAESMDPPTAGLAALGGAVTAGLFDCPYGSEPSRVDWRYVPPPSDFIALRCTHGPPAHCFEMRGSRFYHVSCA